jgi:hypothetical protein
MENFSHWDFAELFSGVDAASLMVGIDPSNFEHPKGKITPVIQRMMSDYEGALSAAVWAHEFEDGVNRKLPDPVKHPKHLYSHRMFHLTGYEIQSDRLSLKHWLQDKDKAVFENQKFYSVKMLLQGINFDYFKRSIINYFQYIIKFILNLEISNKSFLLNCHNSKINN